MYFSGRLPRPPWETRARVEGDDQAARSQRTSRTTAIASASRPCSRDSRRSSISGIAACARAKKDGPGPFARQPAAETEEGAGESRRQGAVRRLVQGSDEGDGQAPRPLRHAARRARAAGRAEHPVSQVHRAREGAGVEAEEGRRAGSGVSGVGEGRKAELYGEGFEGRRSKARSPRLPAVPRNGEAELRVRPW